jgi:hypothetical protein
MARRVRVSMPQFAFLPGREILTAPQSGARTGCRELCVLIASFVERKNIAPLFAGLSGALIGAERNDAVSNLLVWRVK